VVFVAKDAKGFQKSLGGDIFTVSWQRAGQDEPPTTGKIPTHFSSLSNCAMDEWMRECCFIPAESARCA